jgi:FixJ family two-component response regulator
MKISIEKKKIYIVDDDLSVCRALRLLLDTYGFRIQTFVSAAKSFAAILKHTPACLILDIHMTGIGGLALQQKLNSKGFRIPTIFISADKNLKLSKQYLKTVGAVGFLQKPFNDQALVDLINVAIGKNRRGGML